MCVQWRIQLRLAPILEPVRRVGGCADHESTFECYAGGGSGGNGGSNSNVNNNNNVNVNNGDLLWSGAHRVSVRGDIYVRQRRRTPEALCAARSAGWLGNPHYQQGVPLSHRSMSHHIP